MNNKEIEEIVEGILIAITNIDTEEELRESITNALKTTAQKAKEEVEEAVDYRIVGAYGDMMQFAQQNKQIVGPFITEKNEYYLTLEQIERFLQTLKK